MYTRSRKLGYFAYGNTNECIFEMKMYSKKQPHKL